MHMPHPHPISTAPRAGPSPAPHARDRKEQRAPPASCPLRFNLTIHLYALPQRSLPVHASRKQVRTRVGRSDLVVALVLGPWPLHRRGLWRPRRTCRGARDMIFIRASGCVVGHQAPRPQHPRPPLPARVIICDEDQYTSLPQRMSLPRRFQNTHFSNFGGAHFSSTFGPLIHAPRAAGRHGVRAGSIYWLCSVMLSIPLSFSF